MTDPDAYLYREHTMAPARSPKLSAIETAVSMLKEGRLRSEIVRATGLTAEQVNEIREGIKP